MLNIDKVPYEWRQQMEQKMSWEEAVSRGLQLRESKDNSQWDLGDLALAVEKVYGVDSLGKFSIDININKKSLQQYRRVSSAFPLNTRSKLLSHRHHLILASHDDRFALLKECEDNGTTTSQLELRFSKNPQNTINKKEVLVCETCNKFIIDSNNICLCKK